MPIKIATDYLLRDKDWNELTHREWVDYAISCGFDAMELSGDRLPKDFEKRDEVINYAKQKGFEFTIHSNNYKTNIIDTDIQNRKMSVDLVKGCIDVAAKHGIKVVTFHPGRCSAENDNKEQKWQQLLNVVEQIAIYAKEKKVKVAVENMELRPNELVYTIDDLNRFAYIGKDNPYFGVTVDFVHFASCGITEPDLNKLQLPIFNVHISQLTDKGIHLPLTQKNGIVNVDLVCKNLKQYGYDGFMVLEIGYDQKESKIMLQKI